MSLEISQESREWKEAHTNMGKASQPHTDWAATAKQIWDSLSVKKRCSPLNDCVTQ